MKGGYQILNLSTVTVGTKTKTKGSFEQAKGNNGKPVMVLTPDNQRVFAEVVESSGDYILAYLGGDGSTYTVLVEDDDNATITKQESDATIATKVAALETAVGDVTDLDTTSKVLVGAINEVKDKTEFLHRTVLSEVTSVSANSYVNITLDLSYEGYTPIMYAPAGTNQNDAWIAASNFSNLSAAVIVVYSVGEHSNSIRAYVEVLYQKN